MARGTLAGAMAALARGAVRIVYDVVPVPERWYLEDDAPTPESYEHDQTVALLRLILLGTVAGLKLNASVAGNIALRWDREHPKVGVDPDLCLVEPALPPRTKSLLTWKPGMRAPRVAVEVVSEQSPHKDYVEGPEKYGASGTSELWVFDADLQGRDLSGRSFVLQVWRRVGDSFCRVYSGDGPAFSEGLGAWLVVTDGGRRLRLASDAAGGEAWPTPEEMERAAREALEAEVARLRAELAGAPARKRPR